MVKVIKYQYILTLLFWVIKISSSSIVTKKDVHLVISDTSSSINNFPIETIIKKHFDPPSLNVDDNIYSLCLKNAITPLLEHCLSINDGVETFDSFKRLKIGIDLTVCDFIALDKHSFDPLNNMDKIIKEILYINNKINQNLTSHKNNINNSYVLDKYQEILKLIKKDSRIWTTFSIKNEKMNKICSEVEQPLQRVKLEHMVKQYSSDIEKIILSNNELLTKNLEKLETNLNLKIQFVQQEQELKLAKSESVFKKQFQKNAEEAIKLDKKLSDQLLQNEQNFKEFQNNHFFISTKNLPVQFLKIINNIKPLFAYKYTAIVALLIFWTYKIEIFKIAIIAYLLLFEVLNFVSDSMTTKLLITTTILVAWQLNLLVICGKYKYNIAMYSFYLINFISFFMNLIEFGTNSWQKMVIFVILMYYFALNTKPWKSLQKMAVATLLLVTFTIVNVGMSIYDFV
ncbi:hypothetical protein HANVADRAFT_48179 [Hanseniaspora valbyensis NRRL Y-1626]|uniref:Karyogamy protein 5 n=1 Tax=Hanseniaspora valbyensis NRRL Y-1626 TaxID=766949 RepID=A0A1B7TFI6_9ASCO|nr:hypothetical protein HANVADRAFT_48179 [Hanseniaspora valbyensis NRRL Y-1626]